jgi:hypothetical protein
MRHKNSVQRETILSADKASCATRRAQEYNQIVVSQLSLVAKYCSCSWIQHLIIDRIEVTYCSSLATLVCHNSLNVIPQLLKQVACQHHTTTFRMPCRATILTAETSASPDHEPRFHVRTRHMHYYSYLPYALTQITTLQTLAFGFLQRPKPWVPPTCRSQIPRPGTWSARDYSGQARF